MLKTVRSRYSSPHLAKESQDSEKLSNFTGSHSCYVVEPGFQPCSFHIALHTTHYTPGTDLSGGGGGIDCPWAGSPLTSLWQVSGRQSVQVPVPKASGNGVWTASFRLCHCHPEQSRCNWRAETTSIFCPSLKVVKQNLARTVSVIKAFLARPPSTRGQDRTQIHLLPSQCREIIICFIRGSLVSHLESLAKYVTRDFKPLLQVHLQSSREFLSFSDR